MVLAAAGAAVAQPMAAAQEKKTPPVLEPLPEIAGDADLEPQVTITRRQDQTVEEARVNGRLVWIKVTPVHGRPYFLIPDGRRIIHPSRQPGLGTEGSAVGAVHVLTT